jgi:hypothetical protein
MYSVDKSAATETENQFHVGVTQLDIHFFLKKRRGSFDSTLSNATCKIWRKGPLSIFDFFIT